MGDETYDIVVVGGGGSGLAAAAEAASFGAKVLLIEKGEKLGGTTGWSVGSFTASATPHQMRAGVVDSPEQHYADMDLVNAAAKRADNLALRRILTFEAPDTLRWLMGLGVEFIGPNPEPPHTKPRMHNVVPGSKSYIYHVGRRCRQLGVTIHTATALVNLVQEGGRIVGIEAKGPDGGIRAWRASQAVILASGDFSGSRDMRARYFAQEVVNAEPMNPLNTGDPLVIGEKLGSRIINGEYYAFYMPRMRFVPPSHENWEMRLPPWRSLAKAIQWGMAYAPSAIMRPFLMRFITTSLGPEPTLFKAGAALVDTKGKLLKVDLSSPAKHLALEGGNEGFIVFDSKIGTAFQAWPNAVSTAPNVAYAYLDDYKAARKDLYHEASSVEDLARSLNVDASTLKAALVAHNAAQTSAEKRHDTPPFFALGPVRGYLTQTEGGLDVTDRLEVRGRDGKAIPGLYAAGSAGQGGVLLDGHGHHIAWAFISGRHAARSALGRLKPNSDQ